MRNNEKLIEKISELCSQRKLSKFGYENWNGADEHQLICLIKEAEKTLKLSNHSDWKYLLDEHNEYNFTIQRNDTEYGTDINTSAPCSLGKTPLECLKNGWKMWSIPPFLVMNAEYYCKGISIKDVL